MKSKTNKLRKEILEHYKYALKLKKAIDKKIKLCRYGITIMKTNKLRGDFEKLMEDTTLVTAIRTDDYGGYYQKDVDRIWKFIETAIQAEKKKWKQEALKVMPEEINAIDGFYGKSEIEAGFEYTYNSAIRDCKKAIEDL